MQKISVMQLVLREVQKRGKNGADVARELNLPYATVMGMLKRPTLQVQRLIELSESFKYNFFREIAELLPYQEPLPKLDNSKYEEEIATLKEKLKIAEIENTILKDTLKTMASAR